MGRNTDENAPKLPMKQAAFLNLPEDIAFFLDIANGEYYVRIEYMEGRVVMPIGTNLELVLGELVDEYIARV